MDNSTIGYIICESQTSMNVTNITSNRIRNKLVAEGILQTADEKNRNGRYYAEEELFPQLTCPRTMELLKAGYLRAEMGHPISKDLQRQFTIDDTRTCARFLKLWTEGKNIWGTFTATNNKFGDAFNADLEEGCYPAWSLRALGTIKQTNRGTEVRNLKVVTWDKVIYPSHPGAYTQRIVSESAMINEAGDEGNDLYGKGVLIPITNKSVVSFLQAQSSNLKFVRECFDFAYSNIIVNESGSKVILTTSVGDTIYVNLESYVHNELMNYALELAKFRER